MTVMRDISRVIQARQEANLGLSSGDGFYGDKYLWMRPFGSWGEQKERNGVAGYDSRTGGIMIGTDGLVGEKTRAGLALTYAKVNLDGNSSVQPETADVAIWNLLGYGSYAIDRRHRRQLPCRHRQEQQQGRKNHHRPDDDRQGSGGIVPLRRPGRHAGRRPGPHPGALPADPFHSHHSRRLCLGQG